MSNSANIIETIELTSKVGGHITVATIDSPYGAGSEKVVSIGVSLKDGEPDWKVHIPVSNVAALIEALKKVN
jgi:hypothetical protein